MNQQETREAVAEGIGTFMLVLVGAGAVALNPGNLLVAALAHGLILVAIIATFGHISGAHVNPAVTLGLLVGGKISIRRATFYWVAQVIGAVLAGLVLRLVLNDIVGDPAKTLGQTTPANGVNALGIILVEGFLTFFLVSVVYQAAVFAKGGPATPLLIGLTLAGAILLGGPLTGASLNPARTLGPALLAKDTQSLVEVGNYFLGIFLGGVLAAFLHMDLFAAGERETADKKATKKR